MIIKLPTIKKEIVNDELKVTKTETIFNLDTSAYSEYRFEQYFKEQLSDNSLSEFAARISKINKQDYKSNYLSILKILYCYLESEKTPTFIDFIKLFDSSNTEELFAEIIKIFEIVSKSAIKN